MSARYILHQFGNCNFPNTDRRHAHSQVNHFLFVVAEAVGVELFANGWVFGFLFFVLVEDPFERGTVGESVISCRR